MNHIIGLPTKDGIEKSIFDYESYSMILFLFQSFTTLQSITSNTNTCAKHEIKKEEIRQYFEITVKKRKETETELQRYCREIREEVANWDLSFQKKFQGGEGMDSVESKKLDAERQKDRELDNDNLLSSLMERSRRYKKKIEKQEWCSDETAFLPHTLTSKSDAFIKIILFH